MGIVLGLLSDCACLSGTQDQKDLPPSLANHTCPMEDAFQARLRRNGYGQCLLKFGNLDTRWWEVTLAGV